MTFDHFSGSAGSLDLLLSSPSDLECSPSGLTSSAASTRVNEPSVSPVTQFVSDLHRFERLLRNAFAAGGRVQTSAIKAQAAENMSPIAGHQVLAAIAAAQAALSEALSQTAGGHRMLERIGHSMDYDVHAFGETTKPPSESAISRPRSQSLDAAR